MNTNVGLFFAILVPISFALMNVFDSFVIKKKIKHILGFSAVSGLTNIILGIILASFLSWENINFFDLKFPILAGAVYGVQLYVYYGLMLKHDASNAVGLTYLYPILVSILSFIFIGEKLSLIGYVGAVITLIGVLSINLRLNRLKISIGIWTVAVVILTSALNEFFIKLSTTNISNWHGTAVVSITMGITILFSITKKNIRKGFLSELKNFKFTLISESLTMIALVTLFVAMSYLPATVVSTIGVTQPLFVLIFESIAVSLGIKISDDKNWKSKSFSIILIVIGVILTSI